MIQSIPLSVRYMIMSAFGFAIMGACVKALSQSGIPLMEIVAARAVISLGISYLDIKRKGLSLLGKRHDLLLTRGLVSTFTLLCVYYAITTLPLAEATVLQYLNPMFTAILALLFLHEKLLRSTLVSILLSFCGLLIIAQPDFLFGAGAARLPLDAVGIAVLGAFGSAIVYVLVRKMSATEDPSLIIFYFPLVALPITLLMAWLLPGEDFVMPGLIDGGLMLLLGLATQVGQLGLTKAMQTETASKATAFSYLQVVFSAVLGWLLFTEVPGFWTFVGGALIVIGALINMLWKR